MSRAVKTDAKVAFKTESTAAAAIVAVKERASPTATVAVKERTSAPAWNIASLFQAGVAALVPVKPRAETKRPISNSKLAETVVTPIARAKAAPVQDPLPARAKEKKKDKAGVLLIIAWSCIAIGIAGLAKVALFPHAHRGSGGSSATDMNPTERRAQLDQMVQYQRVRTGLRLNQERAGVELENEATAPDLSPITRHMPRPNMMAGVPIAGEDDSRRDAKDPPVNPDFPDSRVQLSLQEDINQADWEARAQQQYIEDFKASAKAGGYNVKIDKWGRVTYSSNGHPFPPNPVDEDGDPVPAFPGAVH